MQRAERIFAGEFKSVVGKWVIPAIAVAAYVWLMWFLLHPRFHDTLEERTRRTFAGTLDTGLQLNALVRMFWLDRGRYPTDKEFEVLVPLFLRYLSEPYSTNGLNQVVDTRRAMLGGWWCDTNTGDVKLDLPDGFIIGGNWRFDGGLTTNCPTRSVILRPIVGSNVSTITIVGSTDADFLLFHSIRQSYWSWKAEGYPTN